MCKDTTIKAESKVLIEHTETEILLPAKKWFFAGKRISYELDNQPGFDLSGFIFL